MKGFWLRKATREDADLVLFFIKKIAEYEKMSDEVVNTKEDIEKVVFDEKAALVEIAYEDETPIGYILYFYTYSTFTGKKTLYLEDLFLLKEYRKKGYGKTMFKRLAQIALDNDCARMEWTCLNWNTPSIEFYNSMGAVAMDEWTVRRLTTETLKAVVEK